ncbi:hypothetical protein U9M48_039080 [Paspalum notatum var. saurae]|uniref:Uncharacterized protein n=1 Tax=Paspalum notatum var. saurae TaxID=547442 RepID=A0AAQ3UMQ4_PASNO
MAGVAKRKPRRWAVAGEGAMAVDAGGRTLARRGLNRGGGERKPARSGGRRAARPERAQWLVTPGPRVAAS